MPELLKPDDLLRRLIELERRVLRSEAGGGGLRAYSSFSETDFTITSTSFASLTPVTSVASVRPGSSGRLLIMLSGYVELGASGGAWLSFNITGGPTAVGPNLADRSAGALIDASSTFEGSISRHVITPILTDGLYTVEMVGARNAAGGNVPLRSRALTVIPI